MPYAAQRILLGVAAAMTGIDIAWATVAHFDVDAAPYGFAALLTAVLFGAAYFYDRVRGEPAISAMLFGMGFFAVFSGSCSLLNYFALTIAGPRIDGSLAGLDRAMGFDWPALMAFMANHPLLDAALAILYQSVLPQIIVLVTLLAWNGKIGSIYGFCLSIAIGAILTVSFWTLYPSFGAFSVYTLPASLTRKLTLVLDGNYAHALVGLLQNGPGHIVPANIKGLVGFPSFHAVQALIVTWYARDLKKIGYAAIAVNLGVLIAIPVQGGHHLIDLAGGLAVSVGAVALAGAILKPAGARALAASHSPQDAAPPCLTPQPTAPPAGW